MKNSGIRRSRRTNRAARFNSSTADQVVCLLRDLAERLPKDKGVDSDGVRRQLRALNYAARRILIAKRMATPTIAVHEHRLQRLACLEPRRKATWANRPQGGG